MGLAIAREIARAHGGEVWLENSSHEGSEFRLSLPLKPIEVITVARGRILVDDEPTIRRVMRTTP